MKTNIIRAFSYILLLTALITGNPDRLAAQDYVNTPVSISKEKVRVNGKVFFSHIVLEKQTLFSISKAYNISIDDIYRYNPTLKETGLKKNSIILIPADQETEVQTVEDKVVQAEEKTDETAVEQPEIRVEIQEPEKTIHTVKWFENLDDIAARYGVKVEDIMAANGLKGRKLKSRMKLIIPAPGEYAAIETVRDTVAVAEQPSDKVKEEESWNWSTVLPARKEKVCASLLMPFKATGTSSSRNNMDFYSGVLLAVNDLALNGTGTDLIVHDITSETERISSKEIEESDVVIGPVSSGEILPLLNMGSDVMIVSPLDPRVESLVAGHKSLIQAPTPHKVQFEDLVSWMKEEKGPSDRILVITEKGGRETETMLQMKEAIDSSGLEYATFSYSILEGRDILEPLAGLMTPEAVNRVMIASESEAFVNDVVRNLNVMIHQKFNVVLYAGSRIRSYDTIEVENFHKTNLHVSLSYYIDYDDSKVKNFLLKYRALFNAEPSQFAFQGYDIASYFLTMCAEYGDDWPYRLSEEKNMLQSTFRFAKKEDGGYVNNGVRRIVYGTDWSISKVR